MWTGRKRRKITENNVKQLMNEVKKEKVENKTMKGKENEWKLIKKRRKRERQNKWIKVKRKRSSKRR